MAAELWSGADGVEDMTKPTIEQANCNHRVIRIEEESDSFGRPEMYPDVHVVRGICEECGLASPDLDNKKRVREWFGPSRAVLKRAFDLVMTGEIDNLMTLNELHEGFYRFTDAKLGNVHNALAKAYLDRATKIAERELVESRTEQRGKES